MIWKISEDQGGEQNLQIGTLASSVSSHLKFPFIFLQDKVLEKSHLYTAALQVNNKTCLSYYQKLHYFFQNSLFSFNEAKMAKMELPPSWMHVLGLKTDCVFRRAPLNIRQGKLFVYSFICLFFSLIIFEKLILRVKSECNYKGWLHILVLSSRYEMQLPCYMANNAQRFSYLDDGTKMCNQP